MYPDLSRFPAQHRLLAGDAPVIAGQRAAFAERAMAGHYERDRVFSDRRADRARGLGAIDPGRDIRIANRAAHRNFHPRLPYPHLEGGAAQDHAQGLLRAPKSGVDVTLRQRAVSHTYTSTS